MDGPRATDRSNVPGASPDDREAQLAALCESWTPTADERAILFDPKRLAALHDAELIDVPPVDAFDRLTALLARTLGAPMVVLSAVDATRQFLLSAVGLPAPMAEMRETELAGSMCKHVVLDDAPLVIPDVARDARGRGAASIAALGAGAYLGVPVHVGSGAPVGALCVVDRVPRAWSDADLAAIRDAAAVAATLIDGRRAHAVAERERREKLDILTRLTEAFVTLDRSWRVMYANASAARLAQCTPADAIGRTLWELIPALGASATGTWLRARMGSTGVYEHEWEGVANPAWFEMRVVCSADGMSLFIRDITRRKRTECALAASEARYRQLADVAPVGIFETDAHGACTLVNRTWCELTDLQPHEAKGYGWVAALHPDDRDAVEREWSACTAEQRVFRSEYRFRRGDGTVRWVAGQASATHDESGAVTGFIGTLADITERKDIEEQLRIVNERLELALSGSDIGLWDWDIPSGRVHFNDWLPGMLGYSAAEFPGHISEWESRIHPDDRADVTRQLTAHLRGETPFYRCAHRLRTKDGRWKWILDAGAVVERDPCGTPRRAVGTHVDINESKAAEALFRLVFEKSGDPQLLLDEHGVVDCNEATVRALRVANKAAITGMPMRTYFPVMQPDGSRSLQAAVLHAEQARASDGYRFEWTIRRADGTELPLEISLARALYDGRGVFLMTWHDLTHQRESERILREAKDAAEQASHTKSDFLARMSHELRSPLNSVIGFSRILQKSLSPESAPNESTYLERIHANGVHLLGLINNVLDIARIESGKVEVDRRLGDIAALLRETVQQLEGQAHGRALVVRADVPAHPVPLETDHEKLRQVLINLVGNAIKFTPEGEVVVRLRLADDGTPLAIDVQDTGVGIPADRLQVIFDPFEQAESATTRRFGGTGLGLAISKQLCDLLGYRISVASEIGRGSVFHVTLQGAAHH